MKVTTTALPRGYAGSPYRFELEAAGGSPPYTWGCAPPLPAGLTLDSTGVLHGVPRSASPIETYHFTVGDAAGQSAGAYLTLTVEPALPEPAPLCIARPTIEGKPEAGAKLTAGNGRWEPEAGLRFAYQWRSSTDGQNWTEIAGAYEQRYEVGLADRGCQLDVVVTAIPPKGPAGSAVAAATAAAGGPGKVGPGLLEPPLITGAGAVGKALNSTPGIWFPSGPSEASRPEGERFSYAVQWLRDGVAITGATTLAYTPTSADRGHLLVCRVTATDSVTKMSAAASSRPFGPIGPTAVSYCLVDRSPSAAGVVRIHVADEALANQREASTTFLLPASELLWQLGGLVNGWPTLYLVRGDYPGAQLIEVHWDSATSSQGAYQRRGNAGAGYAPCEAGRGVFQVYPLSGAEPWLYFFKLGETPTGVVEIHARGGPGFAQQTLDLTTAIPLSMAEWGVWQVAEPTAGSRPTLWYVQTTETPTGRVELIPQQVNWSTLCYEQTGHFVTDCPLAEAQDGTWRLCTPKGSSAPELFHFRTAGLPAGQVRIVVYGSGSGYANRRCDFVGTLGGGSAGTYQVLPAP